MSRFLTLLFLFGALVSFAEPLAITDSDLQFRNEKFPKTTQAPLIVVSSKPLVVQVSSPEVEVKALSPEATLVKIETRSDDYELHFSNGNILKIPSHLFHRSTFSAWAPLENGFLLFKNDSLGRVESVWYVTTMEVLRISLELEDMISHQEVILQKVSHHFSAIHNRIRNEVNRFNSPLSRQAQEEESHKSSERISREETELQLLLQRNSPTLNAIGHEHWQTLLTILLGQAEYHKLESQRKLGGPQAMGATTTDKLFHSVGSLGETYGSYRLVRGSWKLLTRKQASWGKAFRGPVGSTLGVITAGVLFYDAAERAYLVWALDIDPTWSPVGTAVLTTDAGQRVKNWVQGKGRFSDRELYRLQTDEFFQSLEHDPRSPEKEVPAPPHKNLAPLP